MGIRTMIPRIYTGGTFDVFHAGHVNFLRQCFNLGEVIVSLNTDEFIEEYKGSPPVMSYKDRETILQSCVYVKGVVPNIGGADSKPTIELVDPDYIVIGTDWVSKDYHKQMGFTQEWLDEKGIQLIYLPYTQGISSTEIKKKCKQ